MYFEPSPYLSPTQGKIETLRRDVCQFIVNTSMASPAPRCQE